MKCTVIGEILESKFNIVEVDFWKKNAWNLLFQRILRPTDVEKKETLVKTLSEILWKAGDMSYSCVVVDSHRNCFELKNNPDAFKSNYFGDGFTERVNRLSFLVIITKINKANLT